jgi:hypothetical protein
MISGQNAKYIVAALTAYKKGERKHPTMRAIAASLSDQDMADLAAFYEKHGTSSIKTVADTRSNCGAGRRGRAADQGRLRVLPRRQLQQAHRRQLPQDRRPACRLPVRGAEGLPDRRQPQVGRSNAIMAGQVKQFKRAELKAMAEYLGSLPGELQTVPQSSLR